MRTLIPSRLAKTALVTLGALSAAATASQALAAISSNVYIEPQETFVLGGAQPGAFDVRGQNRGIVTVEIYAREGEADTLVKTLAPGERFNASFAKGEGALLKNTSGSDQAHVRVRISGATSNLGMGYEGW